MKHHPWFMTALLSISWLAPLQAEMVWSVRPVENGANTSHSHQHAHHHNAGNNQSQENSGHQHAHGQQRKGKRIYLHDGEGARVEFWLPSTEHRPLSLDKNDASVTLRSTGMVSYHLLMATREQNGHVDTALRYQYMQGKPTDYSPATLVGKQKSQLELIPNPLPREHWRYESQKPANFIVLFNGKPLLDQPLRLSTSQGSSLKLNSDKNGHVRFMLPDDFNDVKPGRRNNRPAEFFVYTSYHSNGNEYRTSYSADYYVSPSHWQSTTAGFGAMLIGFIGGMVMIRRRANSEAA